jgi:hypothetical protein
MAAGVSSAASTANALTARALRGRRGGGGVQARGPQHVADTLALWLCQ